MKTISSIFCILFLTAFFTGKTSATSVDYYISDFDLSFYITYIDGSNTKTETKFLDNSDIIPQKMESFIFDLNSNSNYSMPDNLNFYEILTKSSNWDVDVFDAYDESVFMIGLKGDPIYYNVLHPFPDSFDPSQTIIKKAISLFFFVAIICIGMFFFVTISRLFIDISVFRTVLRNCKRLGNGVSWYRTKREIGHLIKLFSVILIISLIYVMVNSVIMIIVNDYIIPFPIAIKIISAFDIDPIVWEKNIEIGIYGDIGIEYEKWAENIGFSLRTTDFLQKFLWEYKYVLASLALYFMFSFYFLVLKISLHLHKRYKKRLFRREIFHHKYDVSKIIEQKK